MVPAAHRPKIWVQIWAQFSLLGAPSALFTLLGITEDSSEVHWPLASHGGSHRFESYSAHHFKHTYRHFKFGSGRSGATSLVCLVSASSLLRNCCRFRMGLFQTWGLSYQGSGIAYVFNFGHLGRRT